LAYGWYGNVTSLRYIGSGEALNRDAVYLYSGRPSRETKVSSSTMSRNFTTSSSLSQLVEPVQSLSTHFRNPYYGGFSVSVQLQHTDKTYTLIKNVDVQFGFGIHPHQVHSIWNATLKYREYEAITYTKS
jgi:hypothetical protein